MPEDQGNPNIQVELTDPHEFHCFRLVLNPRGRAGAFYCETHKPGQCDGTGPSCAVRTEPEGAGRIEVMLHARSLVDLIHKCSLALCAWQAQTTGDLIDKLSRYGGVR